MQILLQPRYREAPSVVHAALTGDIALHRVALEGLAAHATGIASGEAMPVGSVEYTHAALELAGLRAPAPLSYPEALRGLLRRNLLASTLEQVHAAGRRVFVKPMATKRFTGFVFEPGLEPSGYEPDAREAFVEFESVRAASPAEPVWVSDVVRFASEWRYCIDGDEIVDGARYDDGADDAAAPDGAVVAQAVRLMREAGGAPCCWSLDMGVLGDGRTALVEVNDFYAIGRYGRSLAPSRYVDMLCRRWREIHAQACATREGARG